jgi:hypothetical protein
VTLTGQVLNTVTNNPVGGAFVRVLPLDLLYEADENGQYQAVVEIDSTMDLQVVATSDGFSTQSVTVLALAGRAVSVPSLRIEKLIADEPESGRAWSILLLKQSAASIGVRESGSSEVAELTFMVVDSVGQPLVLENSTNVQFEFGSHPGGGESISPPAAVTDNNGLVHVTLSSGTRAGVVQLMATTSTAGRTIRSQPVAISIHGGLPDQTHFSIGPARFNFPGLNRYGIENPISVIVGDQYANPVRAGTSVYFTTTHGIVGGSAATDAMGGGVVNLISANPLPADGIGLVTAYTADLNQDVVTDETPVIFSGVPVISISPGYAAVGQTYLLGVTDQNGNPLAEGTSINVKVEGTAVKGVGTTSVTLDDSGFSGGHLYENVIRGPGITLFTFRAAVDIDPLATDPPTPVVEAITISVSGPNGRLDVVLGGAGKTNGLIVSEGATVRNLPDGRLEVRAADPK